MHKPVKWLNSMKYQDKIYKEIQSRRLSKTGSFHEPDLTLKNKKVTSRESEESKPDYKVEVKTIKRQKMKSALLESK